MESPSLKPAIHVLVCANQRENGKDCCGSVQGMEIFRTLKDWVRQEGLTQNVWVTRTGCMTFCNDEGTTIAIQPHNLWFTKVTMGDLPELQEKIAKLVNDTAGTFGATVPKSI